MRAGTLQKQIKASMGEPRRSGPVQLILRGVQLIYGFIFAAFGLQAMWGEMRGQLVGGFLITFIFAFLSAICCMPPHFIATGIWFKITALFFWIFSLFFIAGVAYSIRHPEVQAGLEVWLIYFSLLILPLGISMYQLQEARRNLLR